MLLPGNAEDYAEETLVLPVLPEDSFLRLTRASPAPAAERRRNGRGGLTQPNPDPDPDPNPRNLATSQPTLTIPLTLGGVREL